MIIVMEPHAAKEQIELVVSEIQVLGYTPHPIYGTERTVIGAIGDERGKARLQSLEVLPGVESVIPILQPFKLASREFRTDDSVIHVGNVAIGGKELVVMAGPCSVESEEQIVGTARAVKAAGATVLRGGAFKPRTSPYAFQGLGEEGLKMLDTARKETGLKVVTEVLSSEGLDLIAEYADIIQIGARNMTNFALLQRVGELRKPVLLKRSMMATIREWLMSAEYILSQGSYDVILCERGIRTFEDLTRNTFDVSAIPAVKRLSHLPIIADPSHGTGLWRFVPPVAKAALAAGADGLMIEVHPDPTHAYSDGAQSLTPEKFTELMRDLRPYAELEGRTI